MKYAKHILFSLLLLSFFSETNAQLLDSFKVILKSRASIDLRVESRYSFIDNGLASISGLRGGVSFKRKIKFGGGISWLKSDIAKYEYIRNSDGVPVFTPKYLRLAYFCLYADFVFYKTKRWQVSIPIQTGIGASWFQYKRTYDLGSTNKSLLVLYEPGIETHFKIFKWFGLGTSVGYRFVLKNNQKMGYQFNSPTYSFKMLFWADQLYYELFPNSKWTKKYGPAEW